MWPNERKRFHWLVQLNKDEAILETVAIILEAGIWLINQLSGILKRKTRSIAAPTTCPLTWLPLYTATPGCHGHHGSCTLSPDYLHSQSSSPSDESLPAGSTASPGVAVHWKRID